MAVELVDVDEMGWSVHGALLEDVIGNADASQATRVVDSILNLVSFELTLQVAGQVELLESLLPPG